MIDLVPFSLPWVLASGTTFFACFISATTGFGQNLIMAPILLLILSPKSVVAVSVVLAFIGGLGLMPFCLGKQDVRKIIPIAIGSLLGIPVGTYIIVVIAPSSLKMLIGGLCVVLAIPLALGMSLNLRREKVAGGIVGFLGGFFTASTSMGGPPVVLYMHNQNWRKEMIRANLNLIFILMGGITGVSLYFAGIVKWGDVLNAASLVPALAAGLALGIFVFPRISVRLFRYISIIVVVVAGIVGIFSGLGII
jgi:uncharacterized membrane protein YfcA